MAKHKAPLPIPHNPFDRLPTWLPPRQLAAWLRISKAQAKALITAAPPRQRRGLTVSKYRFQPNATLSKNCRDLILQLLRDKNYRHRALLLNEVRRFIEAHGR